MGVAVRLPSPLTVINGRGVKAAHFAFLPDHSKQHLSNAMPGKNSVVDEVCCPLCRKRRLLAWQLRV